jgi:Na+/H+-dicarboxylate symporter
MTTEIPGKTAGRLAGLLVLNTTVAIVFGLTVANLMKPGTWSDFNPPETQTAEGEQDGKASPVELLIRNVPKSVLGPLGDKQNIIGVIFIAVAFGIAMRAVKDKPLANVRDMVEVAYEVLLIVLHWIIQLVPIGVFAIVAKVVGTEGFSPFKAMGAFILSVLLALLLQVAWYLLRIRFFSWVKPWEALRGMRDALVMAFSTSSSTATMPVTYACLKENVGVREESASMGALVGANFNNDGTALYEAMAALFIAQLIGQDLTLTQQLIVVLTAIIASVGAAGIPEAGLVTMTLVFSAVGLPIEYIALLLTVDWFLDRCRTTINVLGDVNISCLLDGRVKPLTAEVPLPQKDPRVLPASK